MQHKVLLAFGGRSADVLLTAPYNQTGETEHQQADAARQTGALAREDRDVTNLCGFIYTAAGIHALLP